MNVMRLGTPSGHEFVPNQQRERQIREATAVDVAEFPPSESKFGAAESVPSDRHSGPRRNLADDGPMDGIAGVSHGSCSLTCAWAEETAR